MKERLFLEVAGSVVTSFYVVQAKIRHLSVFRRDVILQVPVYYDSLRLGLFPALSPVGTLPMAVPRGFAVCRGRDEWQRRLCFFDKGLLNQRERRLWCHSRWGWAVLPGEHPFRR